MKENLAQLGKVKEVFSLFMSLIHHIVTGFRNCLDLGKPISYKNEPPDRPLNFISFLAKQSFTYLVLLSGSLAGAVSRCQGLVVQHCRCADAGGSSFTELIAETPNLVPDAAQPIGCVLYHMDSDVDPRTNT